jgi:NADPH:quinone reductase-like Zn-dependent oxidoreductase
MISRGNYPGPYNPGPDGQGLIPTCDAAGEIVAVGEGVEEWKTGDRVHSLFFEDWLTGPAKVLHETCRCSICMTGVFLLLSD